MQVAPALPAPGLPQPVLHFDFGSYASSEKSLEMLLKQVVSDLELAMPGWHVFLAYYTSGDIKQLIQVNFADQLQQHPMNLMSIAGHTFAWILLREGRFIYTGTVGPTYTVCSESTFKTAYPRSSDILYTFYPKDNVTAYQYDTWWQPELYASFKDYKQASDCIIRDLKTAFPLCHALVVNQSTSDKPLLKTYLPQQAVRVDNTIPVQKSRFKVLAFLEGTVELLDPIKSLGGGKRDEAFASSLPTRSYKEYIFYFRCAAGQPQQSACIPRKYSEFEANEAIEMAVEDLGWDHPLSNILVVKKNPDPNLLVAPVFGQTGLVRELDILVKDQTCTHIHAYVCTSGSFELKALANFTPKSARGNFGMSSDGLKISFSPHYHETEQIPPADWMSFLPNQNISLAALTIPGTHDSHCSLANVKRYGGTQGYDKLADMGVTQGNTIVDQLSAGIRYIDLRVMSKMLLVHGLYGLPYTLSDVLETISGWLDVHKSEAVFVSVKWEETYALSKTPEPPGFGQAVADAFNKTGKAILGTAVPTLSQARGRMILCRRFSTSPNIGIDHDSAVLLRVQDAWSGMNLETKWNAINRHLDAAQATPADGLLYLNFCSANSVLRITPGEFAIEENRRLIDYLEAKCKQQKDKEMSEWEIEVPATMPPMRLGIVILDFPENASNDQILSKEIGGSLSLPMALISTNKFSKDT